MKNNTTSECRKTTAARGPRVRRLVRPGGFALLAVLLLGGASGRAESSTNAPAPNAPARPSFDAFRVISDRNIFNPNRFARNSSRVRTETRPTARADAFTLVGLMAYEKGTFAFFDGAQIRLSQDPGGPWRDLRFHNRQPRSRAGEAGVRHERIRHARGHADAAGG